MVSQASALIALARGPLVAYVLVMAGLAVLAVYGPGWDRPELGATAERPLSWGLFAAGIFAVWGYFAGRGDRWALNGSVFSAVFFVLAFGWFAWTGWLYLLVDPDAGHPAFLLTAMWLASIWVLWRLTRISKAVHEASES